MPTPEELAAQAAGGEKTEGDQGTSQVSSASTATDQTQTSDADKKATTKTFDEAQVKVLLKQMREATIAEIEEANKKAAPPADKDKDKAPDIVGTLKQRINAMLPAENVSRNDMVDALANIAWDAAQIGSSLSEHERQEAEKAAMTRNAVERDVVQKTPHLGIFHDLILHDIRAGEPPEIAVQKYEAALERVQIAGLNPAEARRRLQAVPNPPPDVSRVPDRFAAWIEPPHASDDADATFSLKKNQAEVKEQIKNVKPGQNPFSDVEWGKILAKK